MSPQVFRALDIDASGTLEVRELDIAFSKLKAVLRKAKYTDAAADVGAVRAVAGMFEAVVPAALALEKAQTVLDGIRNGTVASRLGDMLMVQHVDVADLKNKWDSDGNGKLDRTELAQRVRSIGFQATDEELAELFDTLDLDGYARPPLPAPLSPCVCESRCRASCYRVPRELLPSCYLAAA